MLTGYGAMLILLISGSFR